jgi:cytochrome c biogenesis protein CcmG, thiol:disulfide interchange protein DsbE
VSAPRRTVGAAARRAALAVAVPLAGVVALAAAGCGVPADGPAAAVGAPAPAYAARTLAGEPVTLEALRGEVLLVNFWATWCPPCRREMPELQRIHEAYAPRGLRVLGVSLDDRGADGAVTAFTDELGITFTILRDPAGAAYSAFMLQGLPVTVLVDREGLIRWRYIGPIPDGDPGVRDAIEAALAAAVTRTPASSS